MAQQNSPASSEVNQLGEEIKHLATDVAAQAEKQAEARLRARKERFGGSLDSVANALRQASAGNGNEQMDESIRPVLDKAAEQVERVARYVQERDVREMARDVERIAREQPFLFLGGAFVVGFVGGRLLKAATANGNDGGKERGSRSGAPNPEPNRGPGWVLGPEESQDSPHSSWSSPTMGEERGAEQSGDDSSSTEEPEDER